MTDSRDITLDIKLGGWAEAGWDNVSSTNGTTYGFCYGGGDDGFGNIRTTKGTGNDTVGLMLIADSRFQIERCSFEGDDDKQMSWLPDPVSKRSGTLTDLNNKTGLVGYTIHIIDTQNNNSAFKCDPQIRNKPPQA